MIFPRLDGALCGIAAMAVGWDTLEGNVVFVEGLLEFIGAFVVENV
jgi:hypothetical protein